MIEIITQNSAGNRSPAVSFDGNGDYLRIIAIDRENDSSKVLFTGEKFDEFDHLEKCRLQGQDPGMHGLVPKELLSTAG